LLSVLLLLAQLASGGEPLPYTVVEKKPLSRDYFTQGLEIVDGQLYLSSGLYGKSRLLRMEFADLAVQTERKLDARLFAEGVTVLGDEVFQLTWRSGALLVYRRADLAPARLLRIPGQGWGITNDGASLFYSDGSHRLYVMAPDTGQVTRTIEVTENGEPVARLNELEWVDGEIWANVWRSDRIVIIRPESGKVRASIDLAGLLPASERRAGTDVLNGIARDPASGALWVTGKRWPWLYRIEVTASKADSR
jgi:glutamine cyclotransferase